MCLPEAVPAPASKAAAKVCPGCALLESEKVTLPNLGRTVTVVHAWKKAAGTPATIFLDEDGAPVDLEALKEADSAARYGAYGALSPDLVDAGPANQAGDVVVIYLTAPIEPPEQDRERIAIDPDYAKEYASQVATLVQAAQAGLFEALGERGYFPDNVVADAPMVHAYVRAEDVRSLAFDPRVAAIDTDEGIGAPTSDDWIYATDLDMPHDWGWDGGNQSMAFVLRERPPTGDVGAGADVSIASYAVAPPNGVSSTYATWSVGVARSNPGPTGGLRSTPPRYAGAAPQSTSYMANTEGFGVGSVESWASNLGCRVFVYGRASSSPSTTALSAHDRYVDFFARTRPCTNGCFHYVASAGNRNVPGFLQNEWQACTSTDTRVQNRFFNGLIVGGTGLVTGGRPTWWGDQAIYPCSAWQNIGSRVLRELPHLVAPAVSVDAGTNSNGTPYTYTGTSASASIVGGIIADMLEQAVNLRSWPEAVRSILMVTTAGSIDGVAFSLRDGVDDTDGAGFVSSPRAVFVGGPGNQAPASPSLRGWYGDQVFPSEFSGGLYTTYIPVVGVRPGDTLRVALSWTATGSCTDPANCSEPILDANLDLYLIDNATQAQLDWSTTTPNNFEYATYTNNGASTINVRINVGLSGSFAPGVTSTYAGLAWDTVGGYFYADLCNTQQMATPYRVYSQPGGPGGFLDQRAVDATALGNSEYAAVWQSALDTLQGPHDIVVALFSKDGTPKDAVPFKVNSLTDREVFPSVAGLLHDRYVVVWQHDLLGIKARVLNKYKGGNEFDVYPLANSYKPDVASYVDPQLGFEWYWVAWQTGSAVRLRMCVEETCGAPNPSLLVATNGANQEVMASTRVATIADNGTNPDERGGAIVAWVASPVYGSQGRVQVACYRKDGSTIAAPANVSLGNAVYERNPVIAPLDDGGFLVAWASMGDEVDPVGPDEDVVRFARFDHSCTRVQESLACDPTWPLPSPPPPWPALSCYQTDSKLNRSIEDYRQVDLATDGEHVAWIAFDGYSGVITGRRISLNPITVTHANLHTEANPFFIAGYTAPVMAFSPECGLDFMLLWPGCVDQVSCGSGANTIDARELTWW